MYKSYYLQQMGIDIWKIRDIKSKEKILVMVSSEDLSVPARRLLDNMLLSTQFKRKDFEILYVNPSTEIDKIELGIYKALIVVGEDIPMISSKYSSDNYRQAGLDLTIIKILHPDHLLLHPIDKSKAYIALRKLELDYV